MSKECIGEGSYGQVILVRHVETDVPYAVKRVPKRKKKKKKKKGRTRAEESDTERVRYPVKFRYCV